MNSQATIEIFVPKRNNVDYVRKPNMDFLIRCYQQSNTKHVLTAKRMTPKWYHSKCVFC